MATITLNVPNDLLRRARSHLGGNDAADVKEYLLSALESLTMEAEPLDKETEAKLIEGLDSPLRKVTQGDWKAKLRRYDARHRKAKRG